MSGYDEGVMTVFSPEGHLLQIQYAQQAVQLSSPVVGIRGKDSVVIAAERKVYSTLFEERTARNVLKVDDHAAIGYAGLRADARVLITRVQIECQIHRMSLEGAPSVKYLTRFMAQQKHQFTQIMGCRPCGISCLIGGIDSDDAPHLFQTDPSGNMYEWKAAVIGRSDKVIREYLEQHYTPDAVETSDGAVILALRALVSSQSPASPRDIEVAVVKLGQPLQFLEPCVVRGKINTMRAKNN